MCSSINFPHFGQLCTLPYQYSIELFLCWSVDLYVSFNYAIHVALQFTSPLFWQRELARLLQSLKVKMPFHPQCVISWAENLTCPLTRLGLVSYSFLRFLKLILECKLAIASHFQFRWWSNYHPCWLYRHQFESIVRCSGTIGYCSEWFRSVCVHFYGMVIKVFFGVHGRSFYITYHAPYADHYHWLDCQHTLRQAY